MPDNVTVIMTYNEAELFKKFMEYYDTFVVLQRCNVFNQKSASITLDFDHTGMLQTIRRNDLMYTRKFASKL